MSKEIDITEHYLKTFIQKWQPEDPEVRKQLNYGYTWEKNTAILFAIRPYWLNPKEFITHEFAKIRYTKTTNSWSLYWMRASGKWRLYEPYPTGPDIVTLLQVIDQDQLGCFFS